MKKEVENLSQYSKILVRITISLVFLWFGINQIFLPDSFIGYLPNFILANDYAKTFVIFNGVFELVLGTLLIIGLFTRITALILAFHLFIIAINLGYNDILVRDLGLAFVTLSIFVGGEDKWCIDYWRKKKG